MGVKDNPNAEILLEFVSESRETLGQIAPLLEQVQCGLEEGTLSLLFRCFHSFKGTAKYLALRHTAELAQSAEALLDAYRRGVAIENTHLELWRRTLEEFRLLLGEIETNWTDASRRGEVQQLRAAMGTLARPGSPLPASPRRDPSSCATRAPASAQSEACSVQVDARKLDVLLGLVSELATAELAVRNSPDLAGYDFRDFQRAATDLRRVARALEQAATALRQSSGIDHT